MSDRVSATLTIGGPVPRGRLDELIDAIEAEDVGPDWDVGFDSREDILAHLANGATGANLCRHEVAAGEFEGLQAVCMALGLAYVLTYDGYGGSWGPARRIWRPGDYGDGKTCSLESDGGAACVTAGDIRHHQFDSVDAVLAHLALFDDPHVPPLEIDGADMGAAL